MEDETLKLGRWSAQFMQHERRKTGRLYRLYGLYDTKHHEYVVTGTKREMEKLEEKFNA